MPEVKEDYQTLIATHPSVAENLYFEFHIQIEHKNKEGNVLPSQRTNYLTHTKKGFVEQDDENLRR